MLRSSSITANIGETRVHSTLYLSPLSAPGPMAHDSSILLVSLTVGSTRYLFSIISMTGGGDATKEEGTELMFHHIS